MFDFTNKTCLVLGGGGFIGKSLMDELGRRGAQVRGFGRISQFVDVDPQIPWIRGDFSDRVSLARAVDGAEVVFHLLGGSTPESSNADPLGDLLSGPAATLSLLEICRAKGVRRFVFASSGGTVYGIPERTPIRETDATQPISAYGVNKLMTEKYLDLYRHLYGMRYTALRIANPFGPHQSPYRRQGFIATAMHHLLTGKPMEIWGDGEVMRDFIFIDDLVQALCAVVGYEGEHHVFNIGSGIGRTMNDVVRDVINELKIENPNVVYKPGRPADVPRNVLDISLAGRELGWGPSTPWPQALNRTADWMQAHLKTR